MTATEAAAGVTLRQASNGLRYAAIGDTQSAADDLERLAGTVPRAVAAALGEMAFYFVPLALPEPRPDGLRGGSDETMIATRYSAELADEAICHRNVLLPAPDGQSQKTTGVFISARLLNDRFALAFELFINVSHAFVDATGVPAEFGELAWSQALAEVRGETSQDAQESRTVALADREQVDEKAKGEFGAAAFSDALAIYQLSLAVDFDYSELREREYPLLAPAALADRLRLVARLFPPNPGYEFSVRYRRRA